MVPIIRFESIFVFCFSSSKIRKEFRLKCECHMLVTMQLHMWSAKEKSINLQRKSHVIDLANSNTKWIWNQHKKWQSYKMRTAIRFYVSFNLSFECIIFYYAITHCLRVLSSIYDGMAVAIQFQCICNAMHTIFEYGIRNS